MRKLLFIVPFLVGLHLECSACRRVINPLKPFADQFSKSNATYIIKSDINLHGAVISIPKNSTISFEGGAIINGTIIGKNTLLKGSVKIDKVEGSFKNKVFCSSWSSSKADYYKAKSLFSLKVASLLIDEDYCIDSFEGTINTKTTDIRGKNSVIKVTCDLMRASSPEYLFLFTEPVSELSGLTIQMNNYVAKGFARIQKTAFDCRIHDISIDKISQKKLHSSADTFIHVISIATNDSKLLINNITVSNISSLANKVIGDSPGSLYGVLISAQAESKSIIEVSNCHFSELHNYLDGNMIMEDVAGIYLQVYYPVSSKSSIYIHDIDGYNYGKRLIKTDCSNIRIQNVRGESYFDDTMSLISLNSGDGKSYSGAWISDISFKGKTQYVVASSIDNNKFYNITSIITDFTAPYTTALFIPSDCMAERLVLRGTQQIAFIKNGGKKVELSDIDYDDTSYSHKLYCDSAFITADANIKINKAKIYSKYIQRFFYDIYPTDKTYQNSVLGIVDGLDFISSMKSKDYFLSFRNSTHGSDVSFSNSSFRFNDSVRGFIGLEPSEISQCKTSLKLKNVKVYYSRVDSGTIPLGVLSINDNTFLSMEGVSVTNNSGNSFSKSIFPLYIRNHKTSEKSTKNNLLIRGCTIDRNTFSVSKKSIHSTGRNIEWQE